MEIKANVDLGAGPSLFLEPTQNLSPALISQFSNQCPISEKMTFLVNIMKISCEYNENSVILDRVLTNKSVEWEVVIDLDFFLMRPGFLPSVVDRTCTAEIVLLVTVSAYKWKPSAYKVCFSLNIVTLGENVGKTVYKETASGCFRQRGKALNRNDLNIAR